MKSSKSLVIVCWFMLTVPSTCPAKEWRDIAPLRSTRADVERLLGASNEPLPIYFLPDEVVYFQYSQHPCDGRYPDEKWKVPPGTVLSIRVTLKKQVPFADSRLDLSKFKKVQGDHDVIGHFYYINEEEGFSIEVGQENIIGYIYEPAARDSHLRCPDSAAKKPCGSNQKN